MAGRANPHPGGARASSVFQKQKITQHMKRAINTVAVIVSVIAFFVLAGEQSDGTSLTTFLLVKGVALLTLIASGFVAFAYDDQTWQKILDKYDKEEEL